MDDRIIPFGKHKGKPLEILANDKQYLDWLIAQSWFKEKYINIYNVVINNFREPIDTPEHNKIQIKFLKPEYRVKLALRVCNELFYYNSDRLNEIFKKILDSDEEKKSNYFLDSLAKPSIMNEFGLYTKNLLRLPKPVFESIDVKFSVSYGLRFQYNTIHHHNYNIFHGCRDYHFYIEIKPTVSDDFPAILRQMKASMPVVASKNTYNYYILLIGDYTGIGANKEEFIEYFKSQGYIVVLLEELENTIIPKFDSEFKFDESIQSKIERYCG